MSKTIINLCQEIKSYNHCPNCGGTYEKNTCCYCNKKSNIQKHLQTKLTDLLKDKKEFSEEELMNLYSINSLHIDIVTKILSDKNYKNKLDNIHNNILTKIQNNSLTNEDNNYMLFFIENDIYSNNSNTFINALMKELLTDKLDTIIDNKMILIKRFTEMFMKEKIKNPKVHFKELDDKTEGQTQYYNINLNYDKILKYLNEKNYYELLNTIFHECTHVYQNYLIKSGKHANYLLLLQSKESFIRSKNSSYYNDNYTMYSKETEARYCGDLYTCSYLQMLGIDINNKEEINDQMNKELILIQHESRLFNKKEDTVSNIFDSLDKKSDIFEKYPLLKLQYKKENEKIIPKSLEDLLQDYENYKNGKALFEMSTEEADYLYKHLLKDLKNNYQEEKSKSR